MRRVYRECGTGIGYRGRNEDIENVVQILDIEKEVSVKKMWYSC